MASKAALEYKKNCRLHLLNLPPSTVGEVQEFLSGIQVKEITLDDDTNEAIVELFSGNKVEDAVSSFHEKHFKDSIVKAKVIISRNLICVAHLPLSYNNGQFQEFCQKVGPVKYAYLMVTKTGHSKGYGLVEFEGKLANFVNTLDGKEVEGQTLHADIVKESVQESFQAMQSRCILISGLPESFTDIMHLREVFSCISSPIYCQILIKGEKPLGFGLVEFNTAQDAEDTWNKLKDQKIQGKNVKMTFCIPGHPAIGINNRIIWAGQKEPIKSSLLPDPVKNVIPIIMSHGIYVLLNQKIPNFEAEFTKVLAEVHKGYLDEKLVPVERPGLLGPAPALPMSPMMSPNIQLGLAVFLAATIQKAKREPFVGKLAMLNTLCELDAVSSLSKPSILGDPFTGQANVLFSSLKQHLDQGFDSETGSPIEPLRVEDRLKLNRQKFMRNAQSLNTKYLGNIGEVVGTLYHLPVDFSPRPPGSGLLDPPIQTPGSGLSSKLPSLLGPVPGQNINPLMGSSSMNEGGKGLLSEPRNTMNTGKIPSLLGEGPLNKMLVQFQHMQDEQQQLSNQAIVQAMGLGIGASGLNNLGQTLLGQISKGLVNQIGQNLRNQNSINDGIGGGKGSGLGLLGEVPSNEGVKGSKKNKAATGGKSSLLGAPPMNSQGGQMYQDQGSWKAVDDNRWGSSSGYESGYNNKSDMGGYEYSGDYTHSYDMSGGYMGGYGNTTYNDNDYYNNYQYAANYGSGAGYATSGNGGYGMDTTGLSNSQASGVNYQDGSGSYVKGINSSGLGQDNSAYGSTDGFGGSSGGVVGGYANYSLMGKGAVGDKNYYDYNTSSVGSGFGNNSMGISTVSDMGNNLNSGMGNTSGGVGNNMNFGMGNNMSSGMGNNMNFGMGNNMSSGLENNMNSSMGNNMNSGLGNNMNSSMGNMSGGMGNPGMSGGSNMGGMSMGYGKDNQTGSYSTGMANTYSGSTSGGSLLGDGSSLLGSSTSLLGSGGGLMDNYSAGSNSSAMNNPYGGSSFGTGVGNKYGSQRDQSGMGMSGASTGSSGGLLPSPGDKLSMNVPGNKRGYNQMLPKMEMSSDTSYSSQMSGQYDSYKRTRMY